jgi:peptidylprolyl isomerase
MFSKKLFKNLCSGLLLASLVYLIGLASIVTHAQPSYAALPAYSAVKDSRVLLRQALPIKNELIRQIQQDFEKMPKQANLKRWKNLSSEIDEVVASLAQKSDKLLASVAPDKIAEAEILLAKLSETVVPLKEAIATKSRSDIKPLSEKALEYIGMLEAEMVTKFPFEVPKEYANLPQLKGRAFVEMKTDKGTFTMTIDGYSAPVNAGQFVDLVQRGFYNGQTFSRADDNYFLQAGDPPGDADGFVDPATKKVRTVPMEVLVTGKSLPVYGHTLEEVGLTRALPVLPFSAFGTVAMSHPNNDPNGGSSQFFLYLFESDLTPAGLNLIDGNYTVIGYVNEGEEVLRKIKLGDKIESVRVISGIENLKTNN